MVITPKDVRELLAVIDEQAPAMMRLLQCKAAERVGQLVASPDPQVALRASQILLEHNPFPEKAELDPNDPLYHVVKLCEDAVRRDTRKD